MNLLTLNTLSNKNISTKEEVNNLLSQMAFAVKKFLSFDEYKLSRFYTEEENVEEFEIIENYKFKDAIKSLKRETLDFFSIFLSMKCDNDCLNKITEDEMEKILGSDLYFDGEAFDGQKYIILSYCLEKKTFLLSFGKDKWEKYKVIAHKMEKDGSSEKVILNNIANQDHVLSHYNDKQFDKLPQEDIFYTEGFIKDYLSPTYLGSQKKILKQINESLAIQFIVNGDLIKTIEGDIWEIRVGSVNGLQQSAIRILFKKEREKVFILRIFIKQGESTYDYSNDVRLAKEDYAVLKEKIKNGI